MDTQQFREFAKASVDYIADYLDGLRDRPVISSVQPGYMNELVPNEPPQSGESWQEVLKDMDRVVTPGITHWQSPHFHGYYPTAHSWPGVVGEMLCAGFGCVGLSWMASPAYTELEVLMMNWLGKMLNLPEEFLNSSDGPGGGVIQGSASETTLIALLAAKERTVREMMEKDPSLTEGDIKAKLVAYSSDQSNSSVEKAGMLGSMPMRLLKTDENHCLRGETLLEAIKEDKAKGLIPCYVVGCLGSTPTCAFDNLEELGPICNKEKLWFHIDAAYAGAAFVCPEYQYLMKGVEYADSFNFNPHKWMLVNFDCSAMWVKDSRDLVDAFNVERIYLKDRSNQEGVTPEYRHWQISLGRRFRALKLWFVLRIYGVEGIQKHIRNHIALAKRFEEHVKNDSRFEHCVTSMGLVCFRVKGDDCEQQSLLDRISARKKIFLIAGHFRHMTCIRFVVCSRMATEEDVDFAWEEISSQAYGEEMPVYDFKNAATDKAKIPIEIKEEMCKKSEKSK